MCDSELSCPEQWEYDAAVAGIAAPKEFPGNADIAGIGVILSFVIYAAFTSFLAGSTYFFLDGIVPSDHYSNMDRLMKQTAQHYVPLIIKTLAMPLIWPLRKLPQGVRAVFSNIWYNRVGRIRKDRLQSICLQLADTQLVTGASIMIVLYSTHCTVTQYHFFIGFELASLSFVTFQAILIAVVEVLHKSLFMRVWRFVWIVIMFGAIWASRFVIWNSYFMVDRLYGVPVQCTFYQLRRGRYYDASSTAFLAIESFNLIWSLWSMTVLLFPVIVKFPPFAQIISLTYWIMSWPSRVLVGPRNRMLQWHPLEKIATVLFFASLSVREIIFSQGFDLLRVYAMLIASITQIFYDRDQAASQGRKDDESEWGFGQILPILLLALPLSSFAEALWNPDENTTGQEATGKLIDSTETLRGSNATETGPLTVPESQLPPVAALVSESPHVRTGLERATTFHQREARVNDVVHPTMATMAAVVCFLIQSRKELRSTEERIQNLEADQDKVDDLERQWFDNRLFRIWMVALMASLYFAVTYVVVGLGVPL